MRFGGLTNLFGMVYQPVDLRFHFHGATSATYAIPAVHPLGTFDFAVDVTCPAGSPTRSSNVSVTISAAAGTVGNTLLLRKGSSGTTLFKWTDVSPVDDFRLFEDSSASGSFSTGVATAPSGATGISRSVTAPNAFFLVGARSATCGVGPLK